MTIEAFNAARDIVIKINCLNEAIEVIEGLTVIDTTEWIMEIRANVTHPLTRVNHYGLLPEFLNVILAKMTEERAELTRKLDNL